MLVGPCNRCTRAAKGSWVWMAQVVTLKEFANLLLLLLNPRCVAVGAGTFWQRCELSKREPELVVKMTTVLTPLLL